MRTFDALHFSAWISLMSLPSYKNASAAAEEVQRAKREQLMARVVRQADRELQRQCGREKS